MLPVIATVGGGFLNNAIQALHSSDTMFYLIPEGPYPLSDVDVDITHATGEEMKAAEGVHVYSDKDNHLEEGLAKMTSINLMTAWAGIARPLGKFPLAADRVDYDFRIHTRAAIFVSHFKFAKINSEWEYVEEIIKIRPPQEAILLWHVVTQNYPRKDGKIERIF